jgi:predicted polyphosphate/ATP-dependent NAD kinase
MSACVGFVVNPIAGLGGRVGLKGTDDVVELALARGAVPRAGERAIETLEALREGLRRASPRPSFTWVTCAGPMGADALRAAGFDAHEVVYRSGEPPTEEDTRRAVRAFLEAGASIVVFCGGDGTARAVCAETRRRVPILGIPAGVKMYSAVFGIGTERTAEILLGHLEGRLGLADAEVLDVDEEGFRAGRLDVRLYDSALTPHEPALVQSAKQVFSDPDEGRAKAEIAEDLAERMQREPGTLFLLGPGSTVASVAERDGLPKSPLGVDAVRGGSIVGSDLAEAELLSLLENDGAVRLIVSPIGAQGFVLGRGNQQLSPAVIRRIGRERIVVVATPMKLAGTPALRFDTGDRALDHELAAEGFFPVLTGYHVRRLVPVEI